MHVMVSIASMFANIFENIDWVQLDWHGTHAICCVDQSWSTQPGRLSNLQFTKEIQITKCLHAISFCKSDICSNIFALMTQAWWWSAEICFQLIDAWSSSVKGFSFICLNGCNVVVLVIRLSFTLVNWNNENSHDPSLLSHYIVVICQKKTNQRIICICKGSK